MGLQGNNAVDGVGIVRWKLQSFIADAFEFVDADRPRIDWDRSIHSSLDAIRELEDWNPVDGLRSDCERLFLVDSRDPEWTTFWARVGSDKGDGGPTLAELADWIAARAQPIVIRPVALLGKPSMCAGAFRLIQEVARIVAPEVAPFRPDTPIIDRFAGASLKPFWRQLRWRSENRLDPLTPSSRSRFGMSVGPIFSVSMMCVVVACVVFSWNDAYVEWFKTICLFALWGCGIASMIWVIVSLDSVLRKRGENRLPRGIRTFRDLAMAITPKA